MTSVWILIVTSLFVSISALDIPPEAKEQLPRPPTITIQPDEVTYAIPRVLIVLRCAAVAQPDVKSTGGYLWKKDGSTLETVDSPSNDGTGVSIVMSQKDGTITFRGSENLPEEELLQYEGVYQCFASNDLGTAMTRSTTLKAAATVFLLPENKIIETQVGAPLQIPCSYNSSDDKLITWKFEPDTVTLNERISESSDGRLIFSNVEGGDDGLVVYCIIKDRITRRSADGPHHTFYVDASNPMNDQPPVIVSPAPQTEPQIVLKDDTFRLKCSATGKPTPIVHWEKVNGVWPTDRYVIEDFGRTVTISNATYDDSSDYRCTASNSAGEVAVDEKVLIHARPFFSTGDNTPRDVIRYPGGNVTIRCQPEGIPSPSIEWRVNGVPIADTPKMDNREIHPTKIRLYNLQIPDSAVYQCIASNLYGSIIKQAYVNVLVSKPLALSNDVVQYEQVVGKSIELKCPVFGSPSPDIKWKKDGADIAMNDRISLRKNKYLRIHEATFDDAGPYSCLAWNEYGSLLLNTSLSVFERTRIQSAHPTPYFVKRGDSVTMSVQITTDTGVEPRSVHWYKSNIPVGRGVNHIVDNAEFTDTGSYKVMVNTTLDHASVHFTLVVQDVPLPPMDFSVEATGATPLDVRFTWQPSDNNFSPIEEYKIEYEENNYRPGEWFLLVDSMSPDVIYYDVTLSPGLNYKFRMWARNSIGWSETPSGESMRYTTPDDAPSVNPVGVSGEGNTPTNMIITWQPVEPVNCNGPGFGYYIKYCPVNDCTNRTEIPVPGSDVTSYEVNGLPTYTPYNIKVVSYNSIGSAADPADVIGFSGEDSPMSEPTNVMVQTIDDDATTVIVTWQKVDADSVRGKVLGYTVSFQPTSGYNDVNQKVGDTNTARVTDLQPNTQYTFSVAVFNSVSSGPNSLPYDVITPESTPGPPHLLRSVQSSDKTIHLAWSSPRKPNGVITGYVMSYVCLNDTTERFGPIMLDDTSYVMTHLRPNHLYDITVGARTSKGVGELSNVLMSTMAGEAPKPATFNVTSGLSNANVTWFSAEGIPASKYFIEYKKSDEDKWSTVGPYASAKTGEAVSLEGLDPGTPYLIRIVSVNDYDNTTSEYIIVTTSGTGASSAGITGQIWFIVLITIIVFLIILIIIVFVSRRRKGGKYSVADKEGQLVDQESQPNRSEDIGEYNDDDEAKKPLNSPTSVSPLNGKTTPSDGLPTTTPLRTRGDSVAGDSIDAFGDEEAREFNEDGSFIGQYGALQESSTTTPAASPGDVNPAINQPHGDAV
uniref:neuronal cell adhesion molecule isoform X2 n=1 Tax=Ciona intestinalis TaxID=7719 RepID=UPI00089DAE1B|nr:neuronal cell adhesion molecule isoform X2 [Ciona intestinalis]|eukprot:XP_018668551.1 neuronal cell adhesion molecule isoform X2 [Ciona intestinalis]